MAGLGYYRIRVIEMNLLPLMERREDLPLLARHLLRRACAEFGRPVPSISEEGLALLAAYGWPGNVRELENVLRRSVAASRSRVLGPQELQLDPPPGQSLTSPLDRTLDELILDHVARVLDDCGGTKREAARRLGISPGRLYRDLEGEDR